MQKTIFFSVSNAGGTIYKIRAFQKLGYRVIAGDANPNAIGKFVADQFVQVPWQKDPDYSKEILNIIRDEKIGVYVPAGENESLEVSRHREQYLELGCSPTAADTNTLELCVDKCKLFEFLEKESDIPLPLFHTVENADDFEEGLAKLSGVKICMKPAKTSGSRGFILIGEATPPRKFFNERVNTISVTPDYVRESFRSNSVPKMIMMEYLEEGDNVNASIISRDGEQVFSSIHTRENMVAGLSTRGTIIQDSALIEINRKIARSLNTTGFVMAQYIGNKLIEINPRWSTSIIYQSVNEYLMGIQVWTGEKIVIDPKDNEIHKGLTYQRYYESLVYDRAGNVIEG